MTRLLLIDNYDSFTFNVYHLFAGIDQVAVTVKRNDESFFSELDQGIYDAVVIGPGPGSPKDPNYFGNCLKVILEYGTQGLPILGICLGFQGIAYAFGASLKKASLPMHGKLSSLTIHKEDPIFCEVVPTPKVMRYHSLMIHPDLPWPDELIITAEVKDDEPSVQANGREIMALEHRTHPIYGLQFHPESFATESGLQMVKNFLWASRSPKPRAIGV